MNAFVKKFTVGKDPILDLRLAKYDVQASQAHAQMLCKIGILTEEENRKTNQVLEDIQASIEAGTFVIEETFEDVHSKLEFTLTQELGEVGKKIHTARSRNDQVLVALHLYAKSEIQNIKTLCKALFQKLISLSQKYKGVLIPGYTHLQVAMPSSFGLWFSAYAESLIDDIILLNAAYQIADQNPLGSAAGYGSSFPINRQMTTELLDFSILKYNVVACQMGRGELEKATSFGLAAVGGTLSKLSADICLYMSQNFGFLTFPKELTTGSSIMPHKQNPDVFELIRAKCNQVQSMPTQVLSLVNNLTSGYHRDFQLLKESLIENVEKLKDCLTMCNFMLGHIQIQKDILNQSMYQYLYSVEVVNDYVMNGMSFRDAYQKVGKEIEKGSFQPNTKVQHTHEGSIGNLCLEEIQAKFRKYY